MCILASLLLALGLVLCFTTLCFSALQEGGSSVRVSLAPRVTVDKRKEEAWDRRTQVCLWILKNCVLWASFMPDNPKERRYWPKVFLLD